MRYIIIIFCICCPVLLNAQAGEPYIRAMAKLRLDQADSALVYINAAIAEEPNNADLYLIRGDIFYNKGLLQKALQDFQQSNKIEDGSGNYGIARYYAATGQNMKSIEFLQKHLESGYKLSQKKIKMDPAFSSLENSREWIALWQKEWYSKLDYLLSDAGLMLENKEYTDALNLLSRYLKEHDRCHEALALRGKVYYEMQSYKNALSDLNSAIEIKKRSPEYYKLRALTQVQLGQYNDAVADYSSALALDPVDFNIYKLRSDALRMAGLFDESSADMNTYMKYMGVQETDLFSMARTMYDKGDYMMALTYINKVLEKNKDRSEYFLFRGNTYLKTNMAKYAAKDYGMALDIDSNLTEAWVNKGKARLAMGDKTGACHDFQIAVQKGSKEAVQLLQENCMK